MAPLSRAAVRQFSTVVRSATPTSAVRNGLCRQGRTVGKRYASTAETMKQSRGDLPWMIGAVAVTIPGVWFLLPSGSSGDHGHGHGDDHGHGKEHDEGGDKEEQQGQEESAPAEQSGEAPKSDDSAEAESQDQGEDDSQKDLGKDDDKAGAKDKKEVEGKSDRQGSSSPSGSGVGPSSSSSSSSSSASSKDSKLAHQEGSGDRAASPEGINFAGGSKKRESDMGGATKVRVDSDQATNIGEGVSSGTVNPMEHKQRGYSNTDTRYSYDVSKDPEKSKKGEGTVETAKVKGTVQPDRPQV